MKEDKMKQNDKIMIAILITGGFITILNQTVMSPALPSIMRDFQITAAVGQWLTTIFLLVNGIMVPITAYLINRFSTRQLFIGSMLIFTAGTVLGSVAPNYALLLCARVLQAVGAGVQMPFTAVMIMLLFPKEKRGLAMGIIGIVISFAPAFGPSLAGWVVDVWGWQYIFAGIVPLAVINILIACFFLRNLTEKQASHLDWLSVLWSTLGFGGLLYGFSAAGSTGWLRPQTWMPILIGAGMIVLFIRRQLRLDEPLLDLRVLKNQDFSCSTVLTMVVNSGIMVGAVVTPIFLQNVLGHSALFSGLVLMPGAVLMGVMSPITGILFDRFGPRALSISGLMILTAGSFLLVFLSPLSSTLFIGVAYTLRSFGISMVNMPVNTWGLNALPNSQIAHGNAIGNTARQVAGSIGTAVLVTIMTLVESLFPAGSAATAHGIAAAFGGSALLTFLALLLAVAKVDRRTNLSFRKG